MAGHCTAVRCWFRRASVTAGCVTYQHAFCNSDPGTTIQELKPVLEAGGLTSGIDFFLAYSPEREDPGKPSHPDHAQTL